MHCFLFSIFFNHALPLCETRVLYQSQNSCIYKPAYQTSINQYDKLNISKYNNTTQSFDYYHTCCKICKRCCLRSLVSALSIYQWQVWLGPSRLSLRGAVLRCGLQPSYHLQQVLHHYIESGNNTQNHLIFPHATKMQNE